MQNFLETCATNDGWDGSMKSLLCVIVGYAAVFSAVFVAFLTLIVASMFVARVFQPQLIFSLIAVAAICLPVSAGTKTGLKATRKYAKFCSDCVLCDFSNTLPQAETKKFQVLADAIPVSATHKVPTPPPRQFCPV
jgi:hypothetical protein